MSVDSKVQVGSFEPLAKDVGQMNGTASSAPPLPPSSHPFYASLPPHLANPPPYNSPAYQTYYQQYMQYMYSTMYAGYYNYGANGQQQPQQPVQQTQSTSNPPPLPLLPQVNKITVQATSPAPPTEPPKPAIKINLKFQSNKASEQISTSPVPPVRKSRFDNSSISNVINEQAEFDKSDMAEKRVDDKKQEVAVVLKSEEVAPTSSNTASTTSSATDIVFDINKWPVALRNYCAKVYQHYQGVNSVSEDQVTKYLQQRITETFKEKPDLNVGWEKEAVPDLVAIRAVAPLSQQQIRQQAAIAAAKERASKILAEKMTLKINESDKWKTPGKRKAEPISNNKRSSGSSSSSNSRSSSPEQRSPKYKKTSNEDFISLSSPMPMNVNSRGQHKNNAHQAKALKNLNNINSPHNNNKSAKKNSKSKNSNNKAAKFANFEVSISIGSQINENDNFNVNNNQSQLMDKRKQRFVKEAKKIESVRKNIKTLFIDNVSISFLFSI